MVAAVAAVAVPAACDSPLAAPRFARELHRAGRFVDAAARVCEEATRACGVDGCAVILRDVIVDNLPAATDDERLAWVRDGARAVLGWLRARDDLHAFALPIAGDGAPVGTLACCRRAPIAALAQRDLAVIAMHLSVWCIGRGVTAVQDPARRLGPRQREVAHLAARGLTNVEIRDALAISVNTVKSRLKEVFARLDVSNRTELAAFLRDASAPVDAPPGISRIGAFTVTAAPVRRR